MKRMHVHVAVSDLERNIGFYSKLFGAEPSVRKPDYAKWMLDDPRVNFAISSRGLPPGVDHLGIQVESAEELDGLRGQLDAAGETLVSQEATTCCYAKSDKHWVADPQGLAWETFHTLDSAPTYGEDRKPEAAPQSACCAPAMQKIDIVKRTAAQVPSAAAKSCC
jgi:catechol 2,3-dioxygenase-like lactoylglutathione lyase family enzyme